MWQTRNDVQSTHRENMTTDKKADQERIAAQEAEEQAALLAQPKIDEEDESTLICRIYPDAPREHYLYIPGDPEYKGPPRAASK